MNDLEILQKASEKAFKKLKNKKATLEVVIEKLDGFLYGDQFIGYFFTKDKDDNPCIQTVMSTSVSMILDMANSFFIGVKKGKYVKK